MYNPPVLTKIGSFGKLTNGLGRAREKDLMGFRALFVVHHPW